jgi:hypothetical protein
VLNERGVLVRQWDGIVAARPEEALWRIDWYGRDPKRTGSPISKSTCTVVFEPKDDLGKLAELQDHDSVPKLVGLFGDRDAPQRLERRIANLFELPESDDVPEIREGVKAKSKDRKSTAATSKAGPAAAVVAERQGGCQAPEAKTQIGMPASGERTEPAPDAAARAERAGSAPDRCDEQGAAGIGTKDPGTTQADQQASAAIEGVRLVARAKARQAMKRGAVAPPGQVRQPVDPVQAALANTLRLVDQGELPSFDLEDGWIAVSLEALKALDPASPWLSQSVVRDLAENKRPGAKITRTSGGVFMMEMQRQLIERGESLRN